MPKVQPRLKKFRIPIYLLMKKNIDFKFLQEKLELKLVEWRECLS